MSRRREQDNRKYIMIAVAAIIVIGAAGAYYYFNIYIPQYREQRYNLLTLFMGAYPVDLDPALAFDTDSTRIIYNIFDRLVRYKPGTTDIKRTLSSDLTNGANASSGVSGLTASPASIPNSFISSMIVSGDGVAS